MDAAALPTDEALMLAWAAGDAARVRNPVCAPPQPPVPLPAAPAARSGAGRRDVPGRVAAGDRRARRLATRRRLRHLAVPHRPQSAQRPLARAAAPPARARSTPTSGSPRLADPAIRRKRSCPSSNNAAGCSWPWKQLPDEQREVLLLRLEQELSLEEIGRDHRRRPGNREIAAALCDGQAARGVDRMNRVATTADPGRTRAGHACSVGRAPTAPSPRWTTPSWRPPARPCTPRRVAESVPVPAAAAPARSVPRAARRRSRLPAAFGAGRLGGVRRRHRLAAASPTPPQPRAQSRRPSAAARRADRSARRSAPAARHDEAPMAAADVPRLHGSRSAEPPAPPPRTATRRHARAIGQPGPCPPRSWPDRLPPPPPAPRQHRCRPRRRAAAPTRWTPYAAPAPAPEAITSAPAAAHVSGHRRSSRADDGRTGAPAPPQCAPAVIAPTPQPSRARAAQLSRQRRQRRGRCRRHAAAAAMAAAHPRAPRRRRRGYRARQPGALSAALSGDPRPARPAPLLDN